MAPRANWKGYLKLSLVSCPVQLFPATTSKERVAFHLLNRETGNRLKRRLVDPDTDETVDPDDQVKGFAVGKNEYVLVEEDEIESVAIESSHTIDIESFVPRDEIDETFLDTPYFLTPDGQMGEEAFAVIREAMRQKGVVGLGRVVLYRRERPVLLEPRGKGLVATTLHYAYEVRDAADYFDDIRDSAVPDEMLDLAQHIIGRKLAHFDPARFEDRYQTALLDLIKAKQQHRPAAAPQAAAKPSNVVSLMDALRRSIAADRSAEPEPDSGKGRAAGKAGGKAAGARSDEKAATPEPVGKAPAKSTVSKSASSKAAGSKSAAKPTASKSPSRTAAKASAGRLRKAG